MSCDPPDPQKDPFRPPAVPVEVCCLHCGKEYDSYLIEWRIETVEDGSLHGFWCCPTPECSGRGFGFDILPTDPEYRDERGGWVSCDEDEDEDDWDEDDEDWAEDEQDSSPNDSPGTQPPHRRDDSNGNGHQHDEDIPF
jgi:hypothetical protein